MIIDFHTKKGCKGPGDLWRMINGQNLTSCFGKPSWETNHNTNDSSFVIIEFEGIVDGAGSFTFRENKVFYEHFTWKYPSNVKINGEAWNDLNNPFVLTFTPNFASARSIDRHGRNTMVLITHENRFVLFIDDSENDASPYRMTIAVKKRLEQIEHTVPEGN